jgi:hypothetical protein
MLAGASNALRVKRTVWEMEIWNSLAAIMHVYLTAKISSQLSVSLQVRSLRRLLYVLIDRNKPRWWSIHVNREFLSTSKEGFYKCAKEGFIVSILLFVFLLQQQFSNWWKSAFDRALVLGKKCTTQNDVLTEAVKHNTASSNWRRRLWQNTFLLTGFCGQYMTVFWNQNLFCYWWRLVPSKWIYHDWNNKYWSSN